VEPIARSCQRPSGRLTAEPDNAQDGAATKDVAVQ
jgi:hypothetical protein